MVYRYLINYKTQESEKQEPQEVCDTSCTHNTRAVDIHLRYGVWRRQSIELWSQKKERQEKLKQLLLLEAAPQGVEAQN